MHRVVVPAGAYARAHGRHCVAFFCHPDKEADLPDIPPRVTPAPVPPPVFVPPPPFSLHVRLLNAAHHLHKRFREACA